METLSFLVPPFLMCLVLVGIHCYLGIHVLKRGVIFIDLSLAQVASLGSTVALMLHFEQQAFGSYLISLVFTFCAALYFAWGKRHEKLIPQEVLIALVYALSSSMVVLVINSLAHGADHIKDILVGKILWVGYADVLKTALIYSAVGLVHYVFRVQMMAVSESDGGKQQMGLFWDFLFFALFGVVITSSVGVAGILLVFSFLVVPALISMKFCTTTRSQLFVGWAVGLVLCLFGLYLSYVFDLPAGAVMVVVFAATPVVGMPLYTVLKRS